MNVDLMQAVRAVPLFSSLRESDVSVLAGLMKQRQYAKNSIILFAHDPCEAFYVLVAGQVKVMLIAEDGREVILSLMRTGDFFGERTLMDNEPHAASVIAMEDSRLLVLGRDDFRRCIMEMPGVAFGLLRVLLNRLRLADHRIGGLILLDVTGRVSNLLLQLADQTDGERIPSPPTHQVMAQMIGASRETVSRAIKALADDGLIETSRTSMVIKSREALEAAAGQLLKKRGDNKPRRDRRSGPLRVSQPVARPAVERA